MTDEHRDQRLIDGESLQNMLGALYSVPPVERRKLVHDQIMSAIDDVCTRRKNDEGGNAFDAQQILVIKDIAYQIVFILDPMNKPETSFAQKTWAEWKRLSPMKKIAATAAAGTFVFPLFKGAYELAGYVIALVTSLHR